MEASEKGTQAELATGIRADGMACSITEHQRAEEALHDLQALTNAIVDSTSDMIWSVDSEGFGLLTFNRGLRDYFFQQRGIRLQTGMRPEDLFPTQDFVVQWRELYQRAILEGPHTRDYSVFAGSNTLQLTFNLLKRDEKVFGISVFGKDITERKRAEDALRQSEVELKEALLAAQMGVWKWTRATDALTWDENLYRIAGRDPKLPVPSYQEHLQIYTPESWKRLMEAAENALATGTPYELDLELVRPDGSKRWLIARSEPQRDASGRVSGLRGTVQDITERKQAEAKLKESEDKFRKAFMTGADAFYIATFSEGLILEVNDCFRDVFGYGREEVIGKTSLQLGLYADPVDRARVVSEVKSRGYVRNLEVQARRKGGEIFPLLMSVNLLEMGGEQLILGVLRDITERKRAEEVLKQKSQELDNFFDISLDLLCIATTDGYFLRLNPAWESTLGYDLAELQANRYIDFVHPDDLEVTQKATAALAHQQKVVDFTNRYRHKDGEYRWLEWHAAPAGNLIYAAARDITERKRAEEMLRESEERFRATFENAGIGMALVDLQGHPIKTNTALRQMLGYCGEELSRMAFTEFTHPDDRDLDWRLFRELTGGKRDKYDVEKRYLKKDGGLVWGLLTASLVKGSHGLPLYGVGMVQDITERKRAEEDLRASEARFRTLITDAPVAIGVARNGISRYVNTAYVRLFGLQNPEEAFGCPILDQFAPQCHAQISDILRRRQQGLPAPKEYEAVGRRKDGSIFPMHVAVSRVELVDGPVSLGFLTDLTERQRAEEELALSEERYRRLFEDAPIGIAFLGTEREITLTNQRYRDFLGLSEAEIHERGPVGILHPDDWGPSVALSAKLRSGEVPLFHMEQRYIRGDGIVVWSDTHIVALRDKDGQLIHTIGWVQDITERKRAEEALRQSEQRYKDFISHSHEGVWRVELEQPIPIGLPEEEILERLLQNGRMAECNLTQAHNIGFSTSEEVVGMRLRDLLRPSDQERLESFRSSIRGGIGSRTVEFQARDKTGNLQHMLRTEIPIVENGMLINIWGITRNITKLKRAEEERQHSLEQMRALAARLQIIREEERKRVAREIHDQLGQALTAIKIDMSSLVREMPAGAAQPSKRASSILQIVDESIQAVRRISTELRPGILDDLGLVAAIEWAGEDFEARTGTACCLDLPQDDIAVDPEQATAIFRIFQETLTNVVRHADASKIDVRMTRVGGDLTLEVHDNGNGVPADKLSSGKSLGILGMRERAMLLGGELSISGTPGNGTTVRVRIPEARRTEREQDHDQDPDR